MLTLNVLAPRYADWPRRRRSLAAGLAELAPDVVAFQEVVRGEAAWGEAVRGDRGPTGPAAGAPDDPATAPDTVRELLGTGWHTAWHSGHDEDGTGAALASRWPLADIRELDLHVTARTEHFPWCATVAARVLAPAPLGPLLVLHHKPSWPYDQERERELQALAAARFIAQLPGVAPESQRPDTSADVRQDAGPGPHVVLLGDFDAPPDAASARFWTGRQSLEGMSVCYRDAWWQIHGGAPGHTFSPVNPLVRAGDMPHEPGRRIDYVLVRAGPCGPTLEVRSCERALVAPVDGVQASDHYGVVADLAVPRRPPGSWS